MSIKDTKDFIEKAVEGGWKDKDIYKGVTVESPQKYVSFWNSEECCDLYPFEGMNLNNILLDPLSWQAVGRVEGWEGKTYAGGYDVDEDGEVTLSKSEIWHVKMNGLTPALIEGKTTDEYLKTL